MRGTAYLNWALVAVIVYRNSRSQNGLQLKVFFSYKGRLAFPGESSGETWSVTRMCFYTKWKTSSLCYSYRSLERQGLPFYVTSLQTLYVYVTDLISVLGNTQPGEARRVISQTNIACWKPPEEMTLSAQRSSIGQAQSHSHVSLPRFTPKVLSCGQWTVGRMLTFPPLLCSV